TARKPLERRVTIYGNSFSQNQAQFFVFQKVYTELSNQSSMTANPATIFPYGDPAILKVEILVPTNQVRRIIGKGGSVITELQRTSGATIKLSKESSSHSTTSSSSQITMMTTTEKSSVSSPEEPSSPNGGDETAVTEKPRTTIKDSESQKSVGDDSKTSSTVTTSAIISSSEKIATVTTTTATTETSPDSTKPES
ncbi:hypothetical protein BLA29_006881, partial [Euroglyphus maynei]